VSGYTASENMTRCARLMLGIREHLRADTASSPEAEALYEEMDDVYQVLTPADEVLLPLLGTDTAWLFDAETREQYPPKVLLGWDDYQAAIKIGDAEALHVLAHMPAQILPLAKRYRLMAIHWDVIMGTWFGDLFCEAADKVEAT